MFQLHVGLLFLLLTFRLSNRSTKITNVDSVSNKRANFDEVQFFKTYRPT